MIPKNDISGTAYPVPGLQDDCEFNGMSLRDRFALAAMQGDWAAQNELCGAFRSETDVETLKGRAGLYYRMADAMLEVRGEA